ncbi:hypothetical protein AK812_SmicGene31774 [Symbiodinium microadriaticum]|uniref:Uncharacterized protein n=1 Tax=Symbiodinium microadriaticum TaxID=2951 RepID=A0A1Q9CVU8_SYMMI|nr:hypothetical protein AK812_SmicGene31774 [Symbiodinium microadriaticum]CAE7769887.1 unnamed protein product [Symbiodinium microadriaticum]CAE7857440.1 unnamed protein product [Symbiodinium sp. KB8]
MVVAELLQWDAPIAVILLVLLTRFNDRLTHKQDYDYVEIFAGAGEVSAKLREEGLRGAPIDILLNPMLFDLTTEAGFYLNSPLKASYPPTRDGPGSWTEFQFLGKG